MLFDFEGQFESLPRKEREKLFKKHEILNASIRLFATKGFDKTTLDEIAAAAEFGKGTIYNYFSSKEEIFVAIMEYITGKYFSMLANKMNTTVTLKDLIRSMTETIYEYYSKNPEQFVLMQRIRNLSLSFNPVEKSKTLRGNFEKIDKLYGERIRKAIESNEIKNMDVEKLKMLMQSMFFGFLHQLFIRNKINETDVKKDVDFLVSVLFNGIENR